MSFDSSLIVILICTIGAMVVVFDVLLEATKAEETKKPVDEGDEWRWCGTLLWGYQCPRCLNRYNEQEEQCPYCKKKLKKFSGLKFFKLNDE